MQKDIKEIHDVTYKNGLVTQVSKNTDKIDSIMKNLNKGLWMLAALVVGFVGQFIWNLIQNYQGP
jgi:hypothetical protein